MQESLPVSHCARRCASPKRRHLLLRPRLLALAALPWFLVAAGNPTAHAGELDDLIRGYLQARGTDIQLAPWSQIARRYALDLTATLPSLEDLAACEGLTPEQMYDYFASKEPMPHTAGDAPYVWSNLLKDADHFLFSN